LLEFATEKNIAYVILSNAGKAFKDYKQGQVPDIVLIDHEGNISAMYAGFNPKNEMKIRDNIRQLLECASKEE